MDVYGCESMWRSCVVSVRSSASRTAFELTDPEGFLTLSMRQQPERAASAVTRCCVSPATFARCLLFRVVCLPHFFFRVVCLPPKNNSVCCAPTVSFRLVVRLPLQSKIKYSKPSFKRTHKFFCFDAAVHCGATRAI